LHEASIIIARMLIAILLLLMQITPGAPFNATKHPNPIITFVNVVDFKSTTYQQAKDDSEIELLSLSLSEGKRTSLEIADAGRQRVKVLGREAEVTYYPVVRQKFSLTDGGDLLLYSFKNPKSPVPPQILDQAAFAETKKPEEARFGLAPKPERLDVRGRPGLVFDDKKGELTVFWQEEGMTHVAIAKLSQSDILRLIEDLL